MDRLFDLDDIIQHLPNLEHLVVDLEHTKLTSVDMLKLHRLPHLKRLTVKYLESHKFKDIVDKVTELSGLIKLQLQSQHKPNPHCTYVIVLTGIAMKMPQLQVFGISRCEVKFETLLEFVRLADNLRIIHLHEFDIDLSESDIWAIEAVVKARNQSRNRIDPLVIYFDDIPLELERHPNISAHLKVDYCEGCDIIGYNLT